jgi:hypothetical protein
MKHGVEAVKETEPQAAKLKLLINLPLQRN